jgi:hypothetical protein
MAVNVGTVCDSTGSSVAGVRATFKYGDRNVRQFTEGMRVATSNRSLGGNHLVLVNDYREPRLGQSQCVLQFPQPPQVPFFLQPAHFPCTVPTSGLADSEILIMFCLQC